MSRPSSLVRATAHAAEERAEQVLHVHAAATEQVVEVRVLVAAGPPAAGTAHATEPVVLLALRRIGQHVVGLVDLLEPVLGI